MNYKPGFDLDSLTTCIVLIDEHGVVDTLNQSAQVLLETSLQRASGNPFGELAHLLVRAPFSGMKHYQML